MSLHNILEFAVSSLANAQIDFMTQINNDYETANQSRYKAFSFLLPYLRGNEPMKR
jgi:hypothetical protein